MGLDGERWDGCLDRITMAVADLILLVAYSMSFCLVGDPDKAGQSAESD